jgi:hypothetical protein
VTTTVGRVIPSTRRMGVLWCEWHEQVSTIVDRFEEATISSDVPSRDGEAAFSTVVDQ